MKGSIPTPTSISDRKATEMVSDQFPAGLRVLVVDDDPTCLRILEKMLQNCCYAGLFSIELLFSRFFFFHRGGSDFMFFVFCFM